MNDKLRYPFPASLFEEALPLGNGKPGAMHYGGAAVDLSWKNGEPTGIKIIPESLSGNYKIINCQKRRK